jgi:uncharacterized protein involved in cysteine biosynthesis
MRHQLVKHPITSLAALLVLAFGFFMLSASGQSGTYWEDGPAWLGSIGWICFLLSALTFLVTAGYLLVRRVRRRIA